MKKILEFKIELLLVVYFILWFGTNALNLFEIFMNVLTFLTVFYIIIFARKMIIEIIEEEDFEKKEYQKYLKDKTQTKKIKVANMFKMLEKI